MVEVDEVFFAYSYKGTKTANMPRHSRKRGKQVKKRGVSKEQLCVGTNLDRQGNIIIELLCIGIVTANELEGLYGNGIGKILCMIAIRVIHSVYYGYVLRPQED